MDDDRKPAQSGLFSNAFVWLAVLAAGTLVVREVPWQGSRPFESEPRIYGYTAEQDVDARLWQDPLRAVSRGREDAKRQREADPNLASDKAKEDTIRHSQATFISTIAEKQCDGAEVRVLAPMVPGGPYPDYVESRRRARFAILAGLNQMGFVPDDQEHIGYFTPEVAPSRKSRLPEFIAFEWFSVETSGLTTARTDSAGLASKHKYSPSGASKIIVLWLDENVFSSETVARLNELILAEPWPQCKGRKTSVIAQPKAPSVAVLGPGFSTGLRRLVKDLAQPGAKKPNSALAFYAFGATATDAQILADQHLNPEPVSIDAVFAGNGSALFRTIGTDDKLATVLIDEMKRRGVNPAINLVLGDCQRPTTADWQHVVLIAEWDTVYGRSLPHTIAGKLEAGNGCQDRNGVGYPPWIWKYSYLRGLDGQLPTSDGKSSTPKGGSDGAGDKSQAADKARDEKRIELAEGQSQVDYLRRLSIELTNLDNRLRAAERGSIKAIGVLGTDVYDKLLILQALRPAFPNAIFFTTDLDARLTHPGQMEWTRNLIVSSNFGLSLSPELQGDTPPFRDSYQTSLYLSTMIAIHNATSGPCRTLTGAKDECLPITHAAIKEWLREPRVFEIGRNTAYDLSTNGSEPRERNLSTNGSEARERKCINARSLPDCEYVHPVRLQLFADPDKRSLRVILAVAAFCAVLLALAMGAGNRISNWTTKGRIDEERSLSRTAITVIGVAAILLMFVSLEWHIKEVWDRVGMYLTESGDGEPISLTKGISIWPSELIRVIGLVVSVGGIWWGWRALDRNLDQISKELMYQPERRAVIQKLHLELLKWPWWKKVVRAFSFRLVEHGASSISEATGLTPMAEEFWSKFVYQGRFWARFWRVLAATVAYMAIAGTIIIISGLPTPPYRGDIARQWDGKVIMLSVVAMQFLIFFVVDATVFSSQFIKALRQEFPDYRDGASPDFVSATFPSRWPRRTLDHYAAKLLVDRRYLDDWISMHFIARRTRIVARLIYLPFIVISLMILARSPIFDRWTMPPGLIVVFGASFVIVSTCAILLRSAAEASRRKAIWRLTNDKIRLKGEGAEGKSVADQLDVMITQIRAFRSGAFAPYAEQPVVRALLIPLGSYGGVAVLQYLSLANL